MSGGEPALVAGASAAAAFLLELVRTPSLSGDEGAAVSLLVEKMAALGFAAEIDEAGNAVGVRELPAEDGGEPLEIVLLGHIDTVPGDLPVRIEEGILSGRGSVDAKGPLAAFLFAAAQARLAPGTRLVVVGAVEEESATSKGARAVAERFQPAACIIGEPSGWDSITLGYKGRLLIEYTLRQPMAHTAGPQTAAAEEAIAFWNELSAYVDRFNEAREGLFARLLPSLREICTASDGIHDEVRAKMGLRLPPDFDAAAFAREAQRWAGAAQITFYGHEPAYKGPRRSPLVAAFNEAFRARGIRPRLKVKTGTSDMNVVGPRWGCPIVAYGAGDSLLDHTPREHLVVAEYLQSIDILAAVLARLSEAPRPAAGARAA